MKKIRPIVLDLRDVAVRNVLEGRQVETRLPLKTKLPEWTKRVDLLFDVKSPEGPDHWLSIGVRPNGQEYAEEIEELPPYRSGQVLYVRETWGKTEDGAKLYRADQGPGDVEKWHSPITMPPDLARIYLRVKSVSLQGLSSMCDQDCRENGARWVDFGLDLWGEPCDGWTMDPDHHTLGYDHCYSSPQLAYAQAWDAAQPPATRYARSPWVWVVRFEKIDKPVSKKKESK